MKKNIPVYKPYFNSKEIKAATDAINLGYLGHGSLSNNFEKKVAEIIKINKNKVVTVSTGSAAIKVALRLSNVGFNDEVITPSHNNVGVLQAIIDLGAKPVFCDVKDSDLTIDESKIKNLINKKTKAIICIDYGASICNFPKIEKIGKKYGLKTIHDAAHSFGSKNEFNNKFIGHECDFCTFSFDPVKTISCIDGGAVICKNINDAKKARSMRFLGQDFNQKSLKKNEKIYRYQVRDIGYRFHLPNLHGNIGLSQLAKFNEISKKRKELFKFYYNALSGLTFLKLPPNIKNNIVPFMFVIRIKSVLRSKFIKYLKKNNIDTAIHWQAGHKFNFFKKYKSKNLIVTNKIVKEIISLPFYPGLSKKEKYKIVNIIKKFN